MNTMNKAEPRATPYNFEVVGVELDRAFGNKVYLAELKETGKPEVFEWEAAGIDKTDFVRRIGEMRENIPNRLPAFAVAMPHRTRLWVPSLWYSAEGGGEESFQAFVYDGPRLNPVDSEDICLGSAAILGKEAELLARAEGPMDYFFTHAVEKGFQVRMAKPGKLQRWLDAEE